MSKRTARILALACMAAGAARAQDLEIQSLAPNGEMTFGEMSNATAYRVEWTTNLRTMGWSTSAPPGIAAIPPTGFGSRSVSVDVARTECFYRVQAAVTNGPTDLYLVIDLSGGTGAMSYAVGYLPAVPPGGWADEYISTKLVLRKIAQSAPGAFNMGSPANELGRNADETQRSVTLTKDFYIGVFEVTQKQWERVMGNWPGFFTNAACRDSRPVELVSYWDIRENQATGDYPVVDWPNNSAVNSNSFMGRLRAKTGLATLDLPTEAQWEYACRAGATTALNSWQNLAATTSDPALDVLGRYQYNGGGTGTGRGVDTSQGTAKAGTYQANSWGLYDMHGNVGEWCLDWYGAYSGTVTDPPGATTGLYRVVRGGSWGNEAKSCRSAARLNTRPYTQNAATGFRVSRTLP